MAVKKTLSVIVNNAVRTQRDADQKEVDGLVFYIYGGSSCELTGAIHKAHGGNRLGCACRGKNRMTYK